MPELVRPSARVKGMICYFCLQHLEFCFGDSFAFFFKICLFEKQSYRMRANDGEGR